MQRDHTESTQELPANDVRLPHSQRGACPLILSGDGMSGTFYSHLAKRLRVAGFWAGEIIGALSLFVLAALWLIMGEALR